jgi:hypothetical protein
MKEFIEKAKEKIPSVDFIINETWNKLNLQSSYVENSFGEVLIKFDHTATEIFKTYEREALIELATLWLNNQKRKIKNKLKKILSKKGWDKFIEEASKLFAEFGTLVQEFEKDLGNMRKARGGKTFEKVILKLLQFINIKCEIPNVKAKEKLGRIDIVIPSSEVAIKTPDRAIFLTCKRTLRERWKQEIPQVKLNQRIYLLTIDEELSEEKANEIKEKGLIAFVRDEIAQRPIFSEMTWIRKLRDLPRELKTYERITF